MKVHKNPEYMMRYSEVVSEFLDAMRQCNSQLVEKLSDAEGFMTDSAGLKALRQLVELSQAIQSTDPAGQQLVLRLVKSARQMEAAKQIFR